MSSSPHGANPLRNQSPPGDDHEERSARTDSTPLNWLLLVPIVISLAVPFYNRQDPELFGIPFYYWFQLAIIPIGVACTLAVFVAGRKGGKR